MAGAAVLELDRRRLPSEIVLLVWALVWQPLRSQAELGMCRVTWIGFLETPVKCTQTSREAAILVLTKFTGPGGMWHCTQSTCLCVDFAHVSRYGHISWQSVPQNLLLSVNLAASADPPMKRRTRTPTTIARRFHQRDHQDRLADGSAPATTDSLRRTPVLHTPCRQHTSR